MSERRLSGLVTKLLTAGSGETGRANANAAEAWWREEHGSWELKSVVDSLALSFSGSSVHGNSAGSAGHSHHHFQHIHSTPTQSLITFHSHRSYPVFFNHIDRYRSLSIMDEILTLNQVQVQHAMCIHDPPKSFKIFFTSTLFHKTTSSFDNIIAKLQI
jgi:hypothetical protein